MCKFITSWPGRTTVQLFRPCLAIALWTAVAIVLACKTGRGAEDREQTTPKKTEETPSVFIPLAAQDNAIGFSVTPGVGPFTKIIVEFADGSKKVLTINVRPQTGKRRLPQAAGAPAGAKPAYEQVQAEDSFVDVSGSNLRIFARPNLFRYTDPQQDELLRRWESLPPASQTFIPFEFRNLPGRVEMWIQGCYAGAMSAAGGLRQVQVLLSAEAAIRGEGSYRLPEVEEKYCALDIGQIAKPGAMRDAQVSRERGLRRVEGIPLIVADGAGNGDVGVVREMKGSWALECDEHLSRTPFDGMPETLHFSVPQAFYHKAYVLCSVEPDPRKDPVLTVRMTRFARSGRGDAMAHASVVLPRAGEAPTANVRPVGSVAYTAQGQSIQAPLYLAEIDLDTGSILDLLMSEKDPNAPMLDGRYLDIDLLGRVEGVKPARDSTSAVHVFGITLERSPAEFSLLQRQPGNIFHNDELPETIALVKATEPGRTTLSWQITDVSGAMVREQSVAFDFAAPGEERRQTIPLDAPRPGWYGLKFSLAGGDGEKPFLVHNAAFAVLGPDRRKAGYDSPYGTWWFGRAHYGCDDVATIGPLLHKAGFHKTTFAWTKSTEADFASWKVTHNQIGWRAFKPDDPAGTKREVAEWMAKFPHCRSILIFHESYANYLPAELFGGEAKEDEQTVEKARKRVEIATAAARLYRKEFPELKIIAGNTSASAAIIGSLLRHGFDASLIDFIGIETAAGQTGMPEKLWEGGPQGAYLAQETARRFGRDLPVTGCYEYTARCKRNLGPQRHAEFYVRDVLMAHAYHYQHISTGLLYDAGNAYNHTLWGGGGMCRRAPLLYPKPAYVALAAVTAALDQVKFRRKVPTGSLTVYALEFDRADGRHAYALWTPRAEAELALEFPADAVLEQTDFYGAVSTPAAPSGKLAVVAGSAPQYLVSTRPLATARVVRQITETAPAGFQVADKLDDASAWTLSKDESLTKTSGELPRHIPGEFSLRQVEDDERARCLELELHGNSALSDLIGEYAVIDAAGPAVIPGEPHTLGVWVKGNSSWGKVVFEFDDAAGNVWRTHGNEWHDWPGELSINFDGWHLIQFPIDKQSPVIYSSPGGRCQRVKGSGRSVTYPIRLTRFYVVINRKALDPTEMQPVRTVIRMNDAGGY
ncbi:MAG: hypothetical protein GXY83_13165 [Rhodopirellula sp.]|nr:hypothetical protein [Rhodopirellula sp.]